MMKPPLWPRSRNFAGAEFASPGKYTSSSGFPLPGCSLKPLAQSQPAACSAWSASLYGCFLPGGTHFGQSGSGGGGGSFLLAGGGGGGRRGGGRAAPALVRL